MSVKNNAFIAAALLALGVNLTAGAKPVAEGLLNDYKVIELGIAQVDDKGRCIVIATISKPAATPSGWSDPETRVVCASSGDVRLYTDFGGVESLVKKAKLQADTVVTYKRKEKVVTVGDPVATLKTLYKSFKAEGLIAVKSLQKITANITAGVALGWDEAVDTPEAFEYADYIAKQGSVTEWKDYCAGRVTALAAALTAAGVDPATVV